MELSYGLETGVFMLGKPCRNGHRYQDSGLAVRYAKEGHCVECQRSRRRTTQSRAKNAERSRKRYAAEKERLRAEARERMRQYRATPEGALATRETTKRRKALMRGSTAAPVQAAEIRARFDRFHHCCAYCGQAAELHIEHFVAVATGGKHEISNIIPACKECNYSKRKNDPEYWYKDQTFYSDYKWRRILIALGRRNPVVARVLAKPSENRYA